MRWLIMIRVTTWFDKHLLEATANPDEKMIVCRPKKLGRIMMLTVYDIADVVAILYRIMYKHAVLLRKKHQKLKRLTSR